jgi:hypothetical protein
MDKVEIASVIDAELAAAIDADRAMDMGSRQAALNYYRGILPSNDGDGEELLDPNREAVSLDVADMVEAVVAQLVPALQQAGAMEFDPVGPDDEEAAARESAIVRSVLVEGRTGEGGFVALQSCVKDALLMRTGVLALAIERKETATPEEWEVVPEEGVAAILMPTGDDQRVERVSVQRDEEGERERDETGQGPAGPLYRVTLTRVDVAKRVSVRAVARENYVSSNLETRNAEDARFVAERMVLTRHAAVTDYRLPEADVKACPHIDPTQFDNYVERQRGQGWSAGASSSGVAATETIELWRCYAMLPEGKEQLKAARFRVWYNRQRRLVLGEPERVGKVCYALGVVTIFPHRAEGVSLFDKVGEVQELKTKALRNWVENLHKVNRPRLGADETLVNMADAKDATVDVIRMKGPNGIMPIPTIDAGPSVLAFLQYQDQARSERGGASLDMQTAQMQIASNQTAMGIERQYSSKEALAAMMARTFAETAMREAYLSAHYLLRTQWGGQIAVQIGGEWVQDDPSRWRGRQGVCVRVGESRTEQAVRGQTMQEVIGWQAQAMSAGMDGILVDASTIHHAAVDWMRSRNVSNPERYLIDPKSKGAQDAAQRKAQLAAAQQAQQAAVMRAQLMLEKYKVDQSSMTSMIDAVVKAAIEEAKLTLQPDPLQAAGAIAGGAAGEASAESREAEAKSEPGGA